MYLCQQSVFSTESSLPVKMPSAREADAQIANSTEFPMLRHVGYQPLSQLAESENQLAELDSLACMHVVAYMLLLYATQDSKREDSSEQNEEPAERWLCMRWDAHADARELPENLGSTATGAHHALAGEVIACMHPGIHGTGICFRYMFIFTL